MRISDWRSDVCSSDLDPENGTDHLHKVDPAVWKVVMWEDLEEVYRFLRLGDHKFKWVCVDGVTRIHNMALRFVMQQQEERDLDRIPGFVQLKDYGKANELLKGIDRKSTRLNSSHHCA